MDRTAVPVKQQEAALSHFKGIFGDYFDEILCNKWQGLIHKYTQSNISISQCVNGIKDDFVLKLKENFLPNPKLTIEEVKDRQAFLMYLSDLMASYILLFSPQFVRQKIYEHIWSYWAFLDGSVNWVCCSWVVNCGIHDERAHSREVKLEEISTQEMINILRLHKGYLSPDYVSRRSRSYLSQLDRTSLLSLFQSIMVNVLWGIECATENETTDDPHAAYIDQDDDMPKSISHKQILNPAYKEDPTPIDDIGSFHGWMRAYRKKRGGSSNYVPKATRLQFNNVEDKISSKENIKVIMDQMDRLNKLFEGFRGDTPVNEILNCKGKQLPLQLSDNITVNNVKQAMERLLEFYKGNLTSNSHLYGYLANIDSFKFLKFLLINYEKDELLSILFAVLQALPELKPIATNQDYVEYCMLPFNTIVKLCFIGALRLCPDIVHQQYDVELDSKELEHYNAVMGPLIKSGAASVDRSIMTFTNNELHTILARPGAIKFTDAKLGDNVEKCLMLQTEQSRDIKEAILSHFSNYQMVYSLLNDSELECPKENGDSTYEHVRRVKLDAAFKAMTDIELDDLFQKIIASSNETKEIKMPVENFDISYKCSLDGNSNKCLNENTIYAQLEKLLQDKYHEQSIDEISEVYDERDALLNMLKNEDIDEFIDDTYSSKSIYSMTTEELNRLAERVLERIEMSPNCEYFVYDETGEQGFSLCATYPRDPKYKFRLYAHNNDDLDLHYGFRNQRVPTEFEERGDLNLLPSWQYPQTMLDYYRINNRIDSKNINRFIYNWVSLGLDVNVAKAGVAHIKKSILDAINSDVNEDALEITPTNIQQQSIPQILDSKNDLLISSNAASGKTLCYLLPIIQMLKRDEQKYLRHPHSPRALILVPSRELGEQVLKVMKDLSHVIKFSSESLIGGYRKNRQKDHMNRLVDVVVATPQRFLMLKNHLDLKRIKYIVLEEADTILNEGFWEDTSAIIDMVPNARLFMVSPIEGFIDYFNKAQREFSKIKRKDVKSVNVTMVNEKNWKRIMNVKPIVDITWISRPNRGIRHQFIHLKGEDKIRSLVNLIKYEHARRCKKIIVFCNTLQSCRAVEHHLVDVGLPATSLHGMIPIVKRRQYYKDFLDAASGILVCTELASRGLHLNADAAIMFDFPLNSADYLRRCGRVARVINNDSLAPKGYAFSLVKKRDRTLAIAIERSLKMPFFPLNNLSSRKTDYNQLTGRLRYLTQAGGYFKLAKLLRQEEIKGTFDSNNMYTYLERFKQLTREMRENSLKKVMLRRRKICKRRRILTRRLKLMKRWNRTIRLKQRLISEFDRRARKSKGTLHTSMKHDDRKCPRMKDTRPIRGKLMQLKLLQDKLNERKVKRNDKALSKFINKVQQRAKESKSKIRSRRQLVRL
ncbi:bifunctional P-loop containing nucleoside triphosphate hydrolase/Helicase superfamily 1-2 [Babesia duncani]|uniref:Bifunctional P-loop containing nucleoside triphosphate hydrolase/Helicase superfamily 1-2 n=1 Tax=Babesia duncani TaxID=323732 RepID=A0AAD9PK60_9APIC|nr:bifunctional P-loop containing nucleoside triphosphate hydrolase/Helicase superfamily 1-2 [Babesia duncani]